MVVDPLMAPSDCDVPSPKLMVTSRMFGPVVVADPHGERHRIPAADGSRRATARVTPVRGLRLTVTSAVFPATLAVTFAVRVIRRRNAGDSALIGRRGGAREGGGIRGERDCDARNAGPGYVLHARRDDRRAAIRGERLRRRADEEAFGRRGADPQILQLPGGPSGERRDRRGPALTARNESHPHLTVDRSRLGRLDPPDRSRKRDHCAILYRRSGPGARRSSRGHRCCRRSWRPRRAWRRGGRGGGSVLDDGRDDFNLPIERHARRRRKQSNDRAGRRQKRDLVARSRERKDRHGSKDGCGDG